MSESRLPGERLLSSTRHDEQTYHAQGRPPLDQIIGARTLDILVKAVIAENSATVVVDDGDHVASGRSWKSREDDPDPDVGYYLALGRALEAMGRDLQRQAWRRVHEKESK